MQSKADKSLKNKTKKRDNNNLNAPSNQIRNKSAKY